MLQLKLTKNKKQTFMFLIIGGLACLTDLISYHFLIESMSYSYAKGVSFLLGSTIAYLMNKYITFQVKSKSLFEIVKFYFLYSFTLILNISINQFALSLFLDEIFVSFLIATACSTICNFIGQKYFVFKH